MALSNAICKAISDKISQLRGTGLKAKIARGMMALSIGTAVEQGIKFMRYMILARILAPDQFALMAIVMSVAMLFEAFTEVGVKQSVIQNKRGADTEYLNVAWWMQAIRGLGLYAIAFLAAPWISSFYDKPELLRLLQVAFLAVLFRGFVSPRAYVLEKQYRFGLAVLLVQGSGMLGAILAIVLAFVIKNVWALVIGFVSEVAIMCVLSYVFVPFLPRIKVERECLSELIKFARGMFGLPILTVIAFHTDVIVLGKVVTDNELGMYYLAMTFTKLPIFYFTRIISPVLLPAFSERQDDRNFLCRAVLKVVRASATLSEPFVAFMACCASGILFLAYGSKYIAVSIPFAILSLHIFARIQGSILAATYFAVGKPHLHRRFVILRAVFIVGLMYPAVIHFGLIGAAAVVVFSNFVALLMQVFWCQRIIDLKFSTYLRCCLDGLLLATPVVLIVCLLRLFGFRSHLAILFTGIFVLIASFAVGMYLWKGKKWDFLSSE